MGGTLRAYEPGTLKIDFMGFKFLFYDELANLVPTFKVTQLLNVSALTEEEIGFTAFETGVKFPGNFAGRRS